MANKIDSNVTGLRIAEETDVIGVLPAVPVWYPQEPNGYNDFGGQITTVARSPINPSRQRKKGVITDLDASGGFGQDVTQTNLSRQMQGFMFADRREKATTLPMNSAQTVLTGVVTATDDFQAAAGLDAFSVGDLVFATGFSQAGNNGLKTVAGSTATDLTVDQDLVDETPTADAYLTHVGFQFGAGEVDIDTTTQTYPRLIRVAGTKDFTEFGLIPGEPVFVGGDAAVNQFAASSAINNGFVTIREDVTDYLEFDKTSTTMVDEVGAGLEIRIFFGHVTKNENDPALIKRRSYQLERTLGQDDNGTMSEYLEGAVANELSLQVRQADKLTADLSYVAIRDTQRDGATGVKSGTRPIGDCDPAFNTSSDFSRIKMHIVQTDGTTNPAPLFGFMTELTLTVSNGVTGDKAIGVLGAFDVTSAMFTVSASVTAYFSDIAAIQAVRNNADVSLDIAMVKDNAGLFFDLPLVALGEGRLNVTADEAITLPLSLDAAEGENNHTLLYAELPYLPTLADV